MKTLIKQLKGKNKAGKKILIIAGVHGDEITPVYMLAKMLKDNDFDHNLKNVNSITIINGLNISGLKGKVRDVVSNSTQDLNRILSNDPEENCIELLKEYIKKNDVIIDIHSSPTCTEFALVDIDEYTQLVSDWCKKADVSCAFRYSGANTIKRYCLENGKLAVTLEINKMNVVDKISVFKSSKMIVKLIDASVDVNLLKSVLTETIKPMVEIKTYYTGLIETDLKNGDIINLGVILYTVLNFEGELISKVKASKSDCGLILCEPNNHFITRGDTLFLIQPL
jgi:predicted deacylase